MKHCHAKGEQPCCRSRKFLVEVATMKIGLFAMIEIPAM